MPLVLHQKRAQKALISFGLQRELTENTDNVGMKFPYL
jgi:hypothetical protein